MTKPIDYAGPTGREKPGEHWNARILREQAEARQTIAEDEPGDAVELVEPVTLAPGTYTAAETYRLGLIGKLRIERGSQCATGEISTQFHLGDHHPQYWIPEEIVLHLEAALGISSAALPILAQLAELSPAVQTGQEG